VAAIIVEPIQGEGGYVVPEDGFMQGLRRICDEHGILLISDEVQAGAGRTGKMWSIQNWDVEPDIVATAKGIASGMPLSAFIARESLMTQWGPGAHGTTYGGNPLACAAALETIKLLEGGLMANATARGEQLLTGLREIQARFPAVIKDVRGIGLMIGVEFDTHEHAAAAEWASFQRGVLVPRGRQDRRADGAAARPHRRRGGHRPAALRRGRRRSRGQVELRRPGGRRPPPAAAISRR
jgi:4-aminobutyrate aminotransferase